MPKKKIVAAESQVPETLPVAEPVESSAEEVSVAKAVKAEKPAKKKVVARKKKAPAKKAVVQAEAPVEEIAEAPAEEQAPAESTGVKEESSEEALPVLTSEETIEEEKPVEAPEAIEAPEPVAEASKPKPVQRTREQLSRRPVMPPPRHVRAEVQTQTKTTLAVGLAAAGALALAAAAAVLSLRSGNQMLKLRQPYATMPTTVATAPWRPRIQPRFVISVSDKVKPPAPINDVVGDGTTEYPIAAFAVRTEQGAWELSKFRVEFVGSSMIKNIAVRDEWGNAVQGTWTPVPNMKDQYDVVVKQSFAADSSKVFTISVKAETKTSAMPLQMSVLPEGLEMRSDAGQVITTLPAKLSGPEWRVVPKPVTKKR